MPLATADLRDTRSRYAPNGVFDRTFVEMPSSTQCTNHVLEVLSVVTLSCCAGLL